MQQNLNPKGKQKPQQDNARNQRNGLAPAAFGRRRLPALFQACRGLRTLAAFRTARPLLKKTSTDVPGRLWTDLTVLVSPEMAFTNFLGKPHKSIRQDAA